MFDVSINLHFWVVHHFAYERSNPFSVVSTQFIIFFYGLRRRLGAQGYVNVEAVLRIGFTFNGRQAPIGDFTGQ